MEREKIKIKKDEFKKSIKELNEEVAILNERIEQALIDIESVHTQEDAEKFAEEHDLEEGFKYIELF